jgi:hypothetical protein
MFSKLYTMIILIDTDVVRRYATFIVANEIAAILSDTYGLMMAVWCSRNM